jgi:hypothetical protein
MLSIIPGGLEGDPKVEKVRSEWAERQERIRGTFVEYLDNKQEEYSEYRYSRQIFPMTDTLSAHFVAAICVLAENAVEKGLNKEVSYSVFIPVDYEFSSEVLESVEVNTLQELRKRGFLPKAEFPSLELIDRFLNLTINVTW